MKFNKVGFAISVEINDDYLVRANVLHVGKYNEDNYEVRLELRRKDIGKWDCMGEEVCKIVSPRQEVNTNVEKLITKMNDEGFFKRYIDRYEFEIKCFEIGYEVEKDV